MWRENNNDSIGFGKKRSQASFPLLAFVDRMTVDKDIKAAVIFEAGRNFGGKSRVGTGIRDKNLQPFGWLAGLLRVSSRLRFQTQLSTQRNSMNQNFKREPTAR